MIELIEDLPDHVAAFRATGKITGTDYDHVINPRVAEVYEEYGKIDYLLLLETGIGNYSTGAFFKDAVLGFVYFTEWRRIAIVSDKKGIKNFTNFFGKFVPGKFRGFEMEEYEAAKEWVSNHPKARQ